MIGVRIRLRMGGTSKLLVQLHCGPHVSLAWRKLIPWLRTERTIIAPDLRGYLDSADAGGLP